MMGRSPNVLVLGASGTVGHALCAWLERQAKTLGKILLVDQTEPVALPRFEFVRLRVAADTSGRLSRLVSEHQSDIVVDVSNAPTEIVFDAVAASERASYVCTAFCSDAAASLGSVLPRWIDEKARRRHRVPHILFSGMNPGVVNAWVAKAIAERGVPSEIVVLEYDDTRIVGEPDRRAITWCRDEFLGEAIVDPAEYMLGRGKCAELGAPAIEHTEDLSRLFAPVCAIPEGLPGGVMGHEECVTLANRYDVPCRFVYSVASEVMDSLRQVGQPESGFTADDLVLVNGSNAVLAGGERIAVRLTYDNESVFLLNELQNSDVPFGTATSYQVVVGIVAALEALCSGELPAGVCVPEEIAGAAYQDVILSNLAVFECLVDRRENRLRNKRRLSPSRERNRI